MKPHRQPGVYTEKNRLFTINPSSLKDQQVYNEHLINSEGTQYRSWNPFRSKLAALLLKNQLVPLTPNSHILYLGAATGTTVSHISDTLTEGVIYAIETSPIAMTDLLEVSKKRNNINPLLADANHPETYQYFIDHIDFIYQDISQRNQADILHYNMQMYLPKGKTAVLMVKARSIDVALKPSQAYRLVSDTLKSYGYTIHATVNLAPYQKDHAALIVSSTR